MKVGIRVPSYAWPGMTYEQARSLRDYARRVEVLGFDSIWVIEHLLVAPEIYGVAWLDPLATLAFIAACTERVQLGTGILVLPLRHPLIVAKEVASLQLLSGGRFIFGVAAGWAENEFAAVGVPLAERGARTDEALAAIRQLLTRPHVTFEGRYFRFEDVTLDPRPPTLPPIWIAGGAAADPASGRAEMPRSVLRRIVEADGWLAGSSGRSAENARQGWELIQTAARERGRDLTAITFAHTQFLHIVETTDRERAIAAQAPLFLRVMGTHRSLDELRADYLMGTVDDMLAHLQALKQAGLQYLVLTPVSEDPHQLDLIARELVPHL